MSCENTDVLKKEKNTRRVFDAQPDKQILYYIVAVYVALSYFTS